MLSPFSFPSDELHARARQLDQATQLVRSAAADLPGPESREGFAGPVRIVFDVEARRILALLADAESALIGATRHVESLANAASEGAD
jgi:hypothetical protein